MIRKVVLFSAVMVFVGAAAAFAAFPPIDLTAAVGTTYYSTPNPDGLPLPGADDGVTWTAIKNQPTGTGVYDPFLRVQANNVEEGFNTDFAPPMGPVPLDAKGGIWTHSITVSDLGIAKNAAGIDCYVFRCDINEPDNDPAFYLSLDEFRLYTSSDAGAPVVSDLTTLPKTLRYDMDAVVDQDVYLNYDLAGAGNGPGGSGMDDLEVLVPVSYFSGALATDNVILYTKMGATGDAFGKNYNADSGDGFEEWSTKRSPTNTHSAAEPTSLLLLGGGLLGLVGSVRRKK